MHILSLLLALTTVSATAEMSHPLAIEDSAGITAYKAERLMDAASFEEAALLYEEVIRQSSDPLLISHARCRIAQSLFLANQYDAVIALLPSISMDAVTDSESFEITLSLATTMKYIAYAYAHRGDRQGSIEEQMKALPMIDKIIANEKVITSLEMPDELFYIHGWIHSKRGAEGFQEARKSLTKVITAYPQGKYGDQAYYLLGTLAFSEAAFSDAETFFKTLADNYPSSAYAGESLFFAARSADEQRKDPAVSKAYRKKIFQEYPSNRYADEAYFTFFSPSEYLQGDPSAIQHLQTMHKQYPDSPFLIHAYYLIGLDSCRDHKNRENMKELTGMAAEQRLKAAIDAFQKAETQFEAWVKAKDALSKEKIDHFTGIYLRAMLERAYANIAIADLSKGTKRHIYLEYAIDLLQQTKESFENKKSLIFSLTTHTKPYHPLHEETEYLLAHVYYKAEKDDDALRTLEGMLKKYRDLHISRGYFLSRVWYNQGLVAMRSHDYDAALASFAHAEEAAKGKILSVDERLDLWIQKSHCYRTMGQYDTAMLVLSQVINEDVVSNLRLKAMYLRAEIYELQGRRELALKQLQATANKGGEWGNQSKVKLGKEYGL